MEIGSAPRAPSGGEPSQRRDHLGNRQLPEVVRKSRGLQCRKEAGSQRAQTHIHTHMRVFELFVLVFNSFSIFFKHLHDIERTQIFKEEIV